MKSKIKKVFGIEKNIFWMGVTSFFTDVASEMIIPVLPIFLSTVLGVNKAFIGLIEGVAEATASILKVFSGWLSDKLDKRKDIVVLGYTLSSLAKPLFSIATSGWHVLFIRFLDRTGKGLRTSPRDALIAESCSGQELGRSFGFHRAMDSAGAMVGPLLIFVLLPLLHNNFRMVFLLSCIPAAIAVFVLVTFVRDINSSPECKEKRNENKKIDLKLLLNRKFILITLVFSVFTLGNSSDAFLLLRAQELAVPIVFIPLLWFVLNFVYSFTSTPAGIFSDARGRKRVIFAGFLIYSSVYFGFANAHSGWQMWGLFAVYGAYYGLTEGVSKALIADVIPANIRGTAYGVFYTSVGFMSFFASVTMGVVWEAYGAGTAFSLGAFLSLIAAAMLFLV